MNNYLIHVTDEHGGSAMFFVDDLWEGYPCEFILKNRNGDKIAQGGDLEMKEPRFSKWCQENDLHVAVYSSETVAYPTPITRYKLLYTR